MGKNCREILLEWLTILHEDVRYKSIRGNITILGVLRQYIRELSEWYKMEDHYAKNWHKALQQ